MKKTFLISLISLAIILSGCSLVSQKVAPQACTMEAKICPDGSSVGRQGPDCEFADCPNTQNTGLANPASVNCAEKGGTLEIITATDGGQFGICNFSDGSQCEEWAFMRGECQPGGQVGTVAAIKQLFIEKYSKNADEVNITINQEDATHARGGVKFGLGGVGEGGYFLAAKVNGQWKIVVDGNGQIDCAIVAPYDFPADMIGDCAN